MHCRGYHASVTDEQDGKTTVSTVGTLPFQSYIHEDIRKLQLDDPILQSVHSAVHKGQPPPTDVVSSWNRGSTVELIVYAEGSVV